MAQRCSKGNTEPLEPRNRQLSILKPTIIYFEVHLYDTNSLRYNYPRDKAN